MARKKRVEEHVNHERWLVSYADFITLLFAFFVVMYSISSINEGKYRVLSHTLEAVFTDPARSKDPIQVGELLKGQGDQAPEPKSVKNSLTALELPSIKLPMPPLPAEKTNSNDSSSADDENIRSIKEISKQLNIALAELIANDDVIIKQGKDWLELEMKSNVLFYSGEARLETKAVPIIGKVAQILSSSANPIQVEGFTDDLPINTSKFPSNWELSAARAASVVHLLDRFGLEPSRMSAIGYGQFKPVADNSTEEGRQKNRRVVLVVLAKRDSRRDASIFTPSALDPIEQSELIEQSEQAQKTEEVAKPILVTPTQAIIPSTP